MARCPVGTDTSFTVFDKGATLDDGPHITARQRQGCIAITNSARG